MSKKIILISGAKRTPAEQHDQLECDRLVTA